MFPIPQPLYPAAVGDDKIVIAYSYLFDYPVTEADLLFYGGIVGPDETFVIYQSDGDLLDPGVYTVVSGVAVRADVDLWSDPYAQSLFTFDTVIGDGVFLPGPWLYHMISDTPGDFGQGAIASGSTLPYRWLAVVADDNGWSGGELWRRNGKFGIEGTLTVGTATVGTVINATALDPSFCPAVDTPFQALADDGAGAFTLAVFIIQADGYIAVAQLDSGAVTVTSGADSWTH